ncbi:hypothetical protein RHSIM_Rhsim03G0025500 [Rhododendron simsii]|uniref:Pentatricopeptide repeat-containing protein n=1 Tax=Rhododendron simsii TaxID=118357 RepID=A0A834H7Z4_RHOSS|nr:hypothetical protein RHSIM_Rhsim03G0025500 [Rhododendron simsii]
MLQGGLKPNIVTYNSLIDAYASHGVNEEALSIFSEMKKNGFALMLSLARLCSMLTEDPSNLKRQGNYMNFGDPEKATELYRSMRKKKVKPDSVTYTVLIREAESTFTTMKVAGCSPDVVTYTTTIHACTSVGDWEKAGALLKEMGMNNVQPDAIAFLAMLQAFNTGCQPAKRENQKTVIMGLTYQMPSFRFHVYEEADSLQIPIATNLIFLEAKNLYYDEGSHNVSVQFSGIRKADLPQHKRVRVAGDRFQKDWSISEVVQRVLGTKHRQDIEGLLNRWVGRFARKNFPVLIRVSEIMTRIGLSNCDEC